MLDCAVGTVKSRCSRGRTRLAGAARRADGRRRVVPDHPGPGNPPPPGPVPSTHPPARTARLSRPTRPTQPPAVRPESDPHVRARARGDPQQQEAVRRLLAEARHDEPVPADVAARLDGVLAQLAAEGPGGRPAPARAGRRRRPRRPAPPAGRPACSARPRRSSCSAWGEPGRRHHRRAAATASAAAAAAADSAELDAGARPTARRGRPADARPRAPRRRQPGTLAADAARRRAVPAISRRVLRPGGAVAARRPRSSASDRAGPRSAATSLTSAADVRLPGRRLRRGPAPGRRATTATRPCWPTARAPATTQTVELLQCGTAEVLRSTVIPFPTRP